MTSFIFVQAWTLSLSEGFQPLVRLPRSCQTQVSPILLFLGEEAPTGVIAGWERSSRFRGWARAILVATGLLASTGSLASTPSLTFSSVVRDAPIRIPQHIAIAPDGEHVYVSSQGALSKFDRSPETGALEFATAFFEREQAFEGFSGAQSMVFSRQGDHLYVLGQRRLAVLIREPDTGNVTTLEVHHDDENEVDGLDWSRRVVLTADERHVIVVSEEEGLAVFARHATTGSLTFVAAYLVSEFPSLEGSDDVKVSPDGRHVYVMSGNGTCCSQPQTLTAFSRDAATGTLGLLAVYADGADGIQGITGAGTLALSHDGQLLIVLSFESMVTFRRDVESGSLRFIEAQPIEPTGSSDHAQMVFTADDRHLYIAHYQLAGAVLFYDVTQGVPSLRSSYFQGMSDIDGLQRADSVILSPDERHLYAVGEGDNDGVAAFSRDIATGELSFITHRVDEIQGLNEVRDLSVTPDGRHLYAVSSSQNALTVFEKHPETGVLQFVESHRNGQEGAEGLDLVQRVEVSPDGRHVYTASFYDPNYSGMGGDVSTFERDPATGRLHFRGVVEEVQSKGALGLSPDGRFLYTTELHNLVVLQRNIETGVLRVVERQPDAGGVSTRSIVPSPDGRHLYVARGHSILIFERHNATGTLDLLQWRENDLDQIDRQFKLAMAPDGRFVYLIGNGGGTRMPPREIRSGVAVYARAPETGALSLLETWFNVDQGIDELAYIEDLGLSRGGDALYTVSGGQNRLGGDALVVFERDSESGGLSFVEVHRDDEDADGLFGVMSLEVSPADARVYTAAGRESAIGVFQGGCRVGERELCLLDNRFRVTVDWQDDSGATGPGRVVPFQSNDSGLFWFFAEDNWEMLVKVLDGCLVNDHYWVFASATTDVAYTLLVTDTYTGLERTYTHQQGTAAPAITDTQAFASCP